ncbi:MAG: T9SS type A sorting domain-containing protein [Flavobacteriales bacterium]|nr:T9SS type A sorting domain-containing protein [Flavobacteriales bacterium]
MLVAVMATNTGLAQQPFLVDPSFGTSMQHSRVSDIVELSDGRLLVAGDMRYNSTQTLGIGVGRLYQSGSVDPGYTVTLGTGLRFKAWNNQWYLSTGLRLMRLLNDGEREVSYQFAQDPFITNTALSDYHVFTAGNVLGCGDFLLNDPVHGFTGIYELAWFDHDGKLDTTKTHRNANAPLSCLQILPDGKFICSGGYGLSQFEGQSVGGIFRIQPNGELDNAFTGPVIDYGNAYKYLSVADDKTIGVGLFLFDGFTDSTCIVRLLPNGMIDPTFQFIEAHHENNTPNHSGSMSNIRQWGADAYIVTGGFTHLNGMPRNGIALIDTAGNILNDLFTEPGCDFGTIFGSQYEYLIVSGLTGPLSDGSYLIHGVFQGYNDGTTNYPNQRYITKLYGPDVGIPEHQQLNLNLYPNPATTAVTLQLEKVPTNATVLMRDALGRKVLQQRVTGHYTTLGVAGLSAGVYVVEVWEYDQRVGSERVVVE